VKQYVLCTSSPSRRDNLFVYNTPTPTFRPGLLRDLPLFPSAQEAKDYLRRHFPARQAQYSVWEVEGDRVQSRVEI
jgi:hypothetical protein